MANVNAPFGFRPMLFNADGGPSRITQYAKPAADSQAIFMNDLVFKAATSGVPLEGGLPQPGCTSAYSGTPGTTLWLGSSLNYGIASTLTFQSIVDSPTAVYIAQLSGSTVKTEANAAGKNANISIATAGSTVVAKLSGMQIDVATIATTAALDLRLVTEYGGQPNQDNLANTIFEVLIMKHAYAQGSAGV
jgi:hypothetical protein